MHKKEPLQQNEQVGCSGYAYVPTTRFTEYHLRKARGTGYYPKHFTRTMSFILKHAGRMCFVLASQMQNGGAGRLAEGV